MLFCWSCSKTQRSPVGQMAEAMDVSRSIRWERSTVEFEVGEFGRELEGEGLLDV